MRLLHFNDRGELTSTNFVGQEIPPYAILSHRWEDSEVLFEDLGTDGCVDKDGYRKIKFSASQAAQDQLQYFWIDTCCIDKWNTQELSESINSMFEWYRNATKCYVFLSDVSVPTATEIDKQSIWETSFRESKWFTRGWTLQELIAPPSVDFFSSEGTKIGDKSSLEQLIHEITSIPIKVLRNGSLDEYSASDRIAWARGRETKEEEDGAYCLLGILGISMPALYNEGKDRVMARLQFELQADSRSPFIVPFFQNDAFVGQEQQLAELEEGLFRSPNTTRMGIIGPPGIGKTQLAVEFAYMMIRNRKGCSVFWIDASDMNSFQRSCSSIAKKLAIPGWDHDHADMAELVKHHLENQSTGQWLLICDNTDSLHLANMFEVQAVNLIDRLPQSKLGSIVFTTHRNDLAKALKLDITIRLEGLTLQAAHTMFKNALITPVSENEQSEVTLLLEELSCVPLAIVQAVAYLNVTRNALVRNYRFQVSQHREEADGLIRESSEETLQHSRSESAVIVTMLVSLYELKYNQIPAAKCFLIAVCVGRKDIPTELLGGLAETEASILTLHNLALIIRRPAESAFELHRLVHLAMRRWLQEGDLLGTWTSHAAGQLLNVFPDTASRNRNKWRRLLPHANHVLSCDFIEQERLYIIRLRTMCAEALVFDGRLKEAEKLSVKALETQKKALGNKHPWTMGNSAILSFIFASQFRWKEAEELVSQLIETSSKVFREGSIDAISCKGLLVNLYISQGHWKEAETLVLELMPACVRSAGPESLPWLQMVNSLASIYKKQGEFEVAEKLQEISLEGVTRLLGDENPVTLTVSANLADTYRNQGRLTDAERLAGQVTEKRRRVLGDEHPDTLESMNNLALAIGYQGRWAAAEYLELRVIEISSRVPGPESISTMTTKVNLGDMYRRQGLWNKALELQVAVAQSLKRNLGDEHPTTLLNMAFLALTLRGKGHHQSATSMMEECITLQKRVLGPHHHRVRDSLRHLENWRLENEQASV